MSPRWAHAPSMCARSPSASLCLDWPFAWPRPFSRARSADMTGRLSEELTKGLFPQRYSIRCRQAPLGASACVMQREQKHHKIDQIIDGLLTRVMFSPCIIRMLMVVHLASIPAPSNTPA